VASPLGYAVNDAEAVAKLLREKFDFSAANIKLLLNNDASRTAIHKTFLDFSGVATHVDDRLVVFFAGHGHTERSRRGDVGYLVPCDGDPSDLSTLIRWDTLTRDADLIEAKHILFVMDACYGGLSNSRRHSVFAVLHGLGPALGSLYEELREKEARVGRKGNP